MKQFLMLTLILLSSSCKATLFAQQDDFIKQYVERLENSRTYLLLVAKDMPEDKYDYKATAESKSFAENCILLGQWIGIVNLY